MKRKFNILNALIACLTFTCSCDNNVSEVKEAVTPKYEGMTINTNSFSTNRLILRDVNHNNGVGNDDNIHNNHKESVDESIENLVNIDVIQDDEIKYYVKPNQVFIIEVHLYNPSDFEIQSFTLNNKKYANYMFKEGSTLDKILLEVVAPSKSGYCEYTIDAIKYIDGTEIKDVDMRDSKKTVKAGIKHIEEPSIDILSENIGSNFINLQFLINDNENIIGSNDLFFYMSNGTEIIEEKKINIGINDLEINNLYSNTPYEYGVLAVYDMIDGRELWPNWLITREFKTSGFYSFENFNMGKDNIVFDIVVEDADATIDSIELYDNTTNVLVSTLKGDERIFSGLLSNHEYIAYINYSYVVNGEKITDWSRSGVLKTNSKIEPNVFIENINVGEFSINGLIRIEDLDAILVIDKVSIFKNNELIAINTANEISFNSLNAFTDYEIRIDYYYDLNDGDGKHNKQIVQNCKTAPHLELKSCSILNKDGIKLGDTIYIEVSLINPNNVFCKTAVVNGILVDCVNLSMNSFAIETTNNGQFGEGELNLVIEKINVEINSLTFSISLDKNNQISTFINGIITLKSVDLVNKNFEKSYYFMPDEKIYAMLTFENKTEYTVTKCNLGNLTKIDNNRYYCEYEKREVYDQVIVDNFHYENSYISDQISCNVQSDFVFTLNNPGIIEISSPDDFINNIFSNPDGSVKLGYYKLMNDIDLSSYNWRATSNFFGVFDGNNHKISNMTFIDTIVDETAVISLFKQGNGYVKDLTIDNIKVLATVGENATCYASGFCKESLWSSIIFENCTIEGNISLKSATDDSVKAGPFVINMNSYIAFELISCRDYLNITIRNQDDYCSDVGLLGLSPSSKVVVINCDFNLSFFTMVSKSFECYKEDIRNFILLFGNSERTIHSKYIDISNNKFNLILPDGTVIDFLPDMIYLNGLTVNFW